jgi:hypothetical protein
MANMFSLGQRYQIYHLEARNVPEGPKNLQPLLARWHFVQHHSCCIQGKFVTRITRPVVILIHILWVRQVA